MTEGDKVHTLETRELIRRGGDPIARPACPNCGRPMHLSRNALLPGVLPDLRRYSCGECGVSATEAVDD